MIKKFYVLNIKVETTMKICDQWTTSNFHFFNQPNDFEFFFLLILSLTSIGLIFFLINAYRMS